MMGLLRLLSAPISRRGLLHACAVAGGSWLSPQLAWGQGPSRQSREAQEEKAVTSREAREEAMRVIPWDQLADEAQRKLRSVVETPSVYRRMPKKTVDCDAGIYVFLLRNPEVVVNMWQVLGISNMTAERTSQYTWKGNDGAGTQCDVELIYGSRTSDLHIIYGEGFYEGQLFKRRMSGRCVLLLRSGYAQDGRSRVATLLDMFLTVDNAGLDLVAKTLSPLVGGTADSNFAETAKFLGRVSLTAEKNGPKLEQLSEKLTKVEPQVREQFVQLTNGVYERSTLGEAAAVQPVNGLRR